MKRPVMREGSLRTACVTVGALLLCAACATTAGPRHAAVDDPLRPGATPLQVARAFYAALHAGDADRAGKLVGSPNGARVAGAFVAMAGAYRDLEDTLRARYGEEATRAVGYKERVAAEDDAIARATESVTGDEAVIAVGDQTLAMLRRVEGVWRMWLDEALTTDAGALAASREAAAARIAVERVAPAIRHGLFESAADALEAFRNELTKQMGGTSEDVPDEQGARPPPVTL